MRFCVYENCVSKWLLSMFTWYYGHYTAVGCRNRISFSLAIHLLIVSGSMLDDNLQLFMALWHGHATSWDLWWGLNYCLTFLNMQFLKNLDTRLMDKYGTGAREGTTDLLISNQFEAFSYGGTTISSEEMMVSLHAHLQHFMSCCPPWAMKGSVMTFKGLCEEGLMAVFSAMWKGHCIELELYFEGAGGSNHYPLCRPVYTLGLDACLYRGRSWSRPQSQLKVYTHLHARV